MTGPLMQFLVGIRVNACRCRACQMCGAAIGITELSRTNPQAVLALEGASTTRLEAEGLLRAALVVLLHPHARPLPDGRYEVDPHAIAPDLQAALNDAFAALGLADAHVAVTSDHTPARVH